MDQEYGIYSDRILVFEGGKLIQSGSHRELLEKDGVYAAMFRKQREAYVLG